MAKKKNAAPANHPLPPPASRPTTIYEIGAACNGSLFAICLALARADGADESEVLNSPQLDFDLPQMPGIRAACCQLFGHPAFTVATWQRLRDWLSVEHGVGPVLIWRTPIEEVVAWLREATEPVGEKGKKKPEPKKPGPVPQFPLSVAFALKERQKKHAPPLPEIYGQCRRRFPNEFVAEGPSNEECKAFTDAFYNVRRKRK